MAMLRHRMPQILEPYFRRPTELSLILLTGTLECSASWLATRYVSTFLSQAEQDDEEYPTAVVMASWSNDVTFWHQEILRTTGLDIQHFAAAQRFVYVDLFSTLVLNNTALEQAELQIENAISSVSTEANPRQTILLLDCPSVMLLLAQTQAFDLQATVQRLRSLVHATIVTCAADTPLTAAEVGSTLHELTSLHPIARQTAQFVTMLAHRARFIAGVRPMDTGAARDVSGVLRITKGGGIYCPFPDDDDDDGSIDDLEALYLVRRDGGVEVFGQRA